MDLRIPVDKINVQELGIQLTRGIATYSYLKLVHNDEQQFGESWGPRCGQSKSLRTVYLLGIQSDQINKWILNLDA